ncbi:MAG: helix-turn-helix transcriptional regulator [Nitrospiraceae bacterium]|nr:helix-turn-helix transcriptional regulator [Nitrospiraceae bacterium]
MLKSGNSIGTIIKEIRKSAGISQMELAEKISVSYQQIQKYENGATKLSLSRLKQISAALGAPLSSLLEGDDLSPVGEQGGKGFYGFSSGEAKLIFLYRKIQNKKMRHGFLKILETAVKISGSGKNCSH